MITAMGRRMGRAGKRRGGVSRTGIVGLGLALMLVVGCAGEGDSDSGGVADDAGSAREAPSATGGDASAEADEAAPSTGGAGDTGEISTTGALDLVAADRDVVRTGTMWLTVDEVENALVEVRTIAVGAGGFVSDEQLRAEHDAADITVSVPTADFDDVRTSIGELGEITEENVQAQDVTADVVDLESRIGSLRASVERMRGLLAEAGDVTELATVESELASRETELEALLGQQRVLADQVALGTLTVRLAEEHVAPVEPDGGPAGFADGFSTGWGVLVDGGRALLAAIGFTIPLAVPVGAALGAAALWQRRRRRDTPSPEGTA